jgi:hypothetical protein
VRDVLLAHWQANGRKPFRVNLIELAVAIWPPEWLIYYNKWCLEVISSALQSLAFARFLELRRAGRYGYEVTIISPWLKLVLHPRMRQPAQDDGATRP